MGRGRSAMGRVLNGYDLLKFYSEAVARRHKKRCS